jgi:hypothetical protein
MKAADDCLAHPELYRDRLECSLAFAEVGREPHLERPQSEKHNSRFEIVLISLAICAAVGLAHSVVW